MFSKRIADAIKNNLGKYMTMKAKKEEGSLKLSIGMMAKEYMLAFYLRNLISKTKATGDCRLPSYLLNFEPIPKGKAKEMLEHFKTGDYNIDAEEVLIN